MKTMSQPGCILDDRRISLSLRFTVFLTTALPVFRLTAKPYRDRASPLGIAFITARLLTQVFPSLNTALNCASRVRYCFPLTYHPRFSLIACR